MLFFFRLEQKLQARKAKVADLKQKQEEAKLAKSKEREKIMANLVSTGIHMFYVGAKFFGKMFQ